MLGTEQLLNDKKLLLAKLYKTTQEFIGSQKPEAENERYIEEYLLLCKDRDAILTELNALQNKINASVSDKSLPKREFTASEVKLISDNDKLISEISDAVNFCIGTCKDIEEKMRKEFKTLNNTIQLNAAYSSGNFVMNDGFFIDRRN